MSILTHSCGVVPFLAFLLAGSGGAREELTLQQAIDLALSRNPRIAIVRQEIVAARGRSVQAGARPNAEVFSHVGEIGFDFAGPDEIEIGLSQGFEYPGKRGRRMAVAESDLRMAELRLERHRSLLTAEVKKSYYENLLVEENLAARQFNVRLLEDLHRLLTERYRGGTASYVDVARGRIELGRARSDLAGARREQVAASTGFNLLLGRDDDVPLLLSDSLAYVPLESQKDILYARIVGQSNLREIFAENVERERHALRLARLAGRPDVSLGVSYQRTGENPPFTPAQPEGKMENAFGIEAGLSLPLFGRAGPKGEMQVARAEMAAAEMELAYFDRRLRRNFEASYAAVRAAEEQALEFRDAILPESREAVDAAVAAYRSGQIPLTDLLDIFRTAREVRLERNRALFDYLTALAELETVGEIIELSRSKESP